MDEQALDIEIRKYLEYTKANEQNVFLCSKYLIAVFFRVNTRQATF